MMLLLPLLLCFLVVDAGPGYGPRYGSSSTTRHWGIIPRGGEETQSRQKVAVGLVRQAASSDSSQSAIFYSDNGQIYASSTLAPDATETLAVASDVLLLVVEPSTASWDVTESIVRGAKRRRDAGFPKLAVVVVLRGIDDNDNEMDRILAQQFADFTPTLVASLDIVSEQNAQAVYQDVIENLPVPSGGDIVVADEEEYKLLIQQVYESLTNMPCDDLTFEPADESFFESQEEEPAEESFSESQEEEPAEESFFESQEETSTELSVTTDTETEAETEPEIELEIEIVSEQDSQGVKQNLLVDAMAELESLEAQQEEVWLSSDAQVPLLHFGSAANSVLDKVSNAVQQAPDNVREAILQKVAGKLQVLYHNQLQSLREQFGRRYEAALDENPDNDQAQADAAARITQGFRAAAQHAIPEQCREGQALVNADFSYVSVLQGLVSDMMEATSMRQDMDDTAVEEEEEENKPAKWYKKLAARAVMVGINYIQGWLAWQGIKKAAAQRDKDMPKFPLF